MELDYFAKIKWRHSEEIEFKSPITDIIIPCMLLVVDFEQELFKLIPFDTENYENESFWTRIEYCERPKRKLKIV